EGSGLSLGEGTVRKVPQRTLAGDRFVHACGGVPVGGHRAVEGGVRSVDEAALDGEFAHAKQRKRLFLGDARAAVEGQREGGGQLVGSHGRDASFFVTAAA